MHTQANLQSFNTFGIQAQAAQLAEAHSVDQMRALIDAHGTPDLVLGGGSNVLLRGDVDGFVLVNRIPGVEVVSQEEDRVRVRVGGGVVWHDFVLHCIDQGYFFFQCNALLNYLKKKNKTEVEYKIIKKEMNH